MYRIDILSNNQLQERIDFICHGTIYRGEEGAYGYSKLLEKNCLKNDQTSFLPGG